MLSALANRFSRSTWQRHLLFLVLTFFTIAYIGYHFGTYDQIVHIPFLEKYADPAIFPNDAFLDLRFQHYSFFWFFFLPSYMAGLLEIAMFLLHVLATYLTFWALWALAETLFQKPVACFLGVLAFAFPHPGFSGFTIFEFSFVNRVFVLPFLLWAVVLFLRRRYLPAFALLGLMYNLHVISVNFVLAMFLFDAVLQWRKVGWRNLLLGIAAFLFCALPVLLWKTSNSRMDLTLRPEWLDIISRGMMYNVFFLIGPSAPILYATLSGLGAVILFFFVRRRAPSLADRTITNFFYAGLIILGVQVVTTLWLPVTIIIESQIVRVAVFIQIFSYLYFANYLAGLYGKKETSKVDLGWLIGAFVFTQSMLVPLVVAFLQRLVAPFRWRQVTVGTAMAAMLAVTYFLAFRYGFWYPGIYIFAHQTPWYDVQVWARENTAQAALFITPPHLWGLFEPDWRVFSQRSTVATQSELLEAAFAPDYLQHWLPRFQALAPGTLERFRGDYFENVQLIAQSFYGLSPERLLQIARQYGASYLVVEKPHRQSFPVVYENSGFVVYDLRSPVSSCRLYLRPAAIFIE